MSLTSKFIQSLIALAANVPAASAATATRPPEPVPAVSARSSSCIDFASNLSTKLDSMRPVEPARFGQVWPRTDFVEIQRAIESTPIASTISPAEALRRVADRA